MTLNKDLRIKIAEMVKRSGEGHIPSSYSIVDIIDYLYGNVLNCDPKNPMKDDRDYFVLSKGHGCGALYSVMHKYGFVSDQDIMDYSTPQGILGGHPDITKVPGVEASTGSLGHGFPMAVGLALGLKIQNKKNRVFVLMGDGECHEGTIWEAANVANNLRLGNLCAIVDWNKSAAQLMPRDELPKKWEAFGWKTEVMNGHSTEAFENTFGVMSFGLEGDPKAVIAQTVKGKGVSFVEGHGPWHHRVPSQDEMSSIVKELSL